MKKRLLLAVIILFLGLLLTVLQMASNAIQNPQSTNASNYTQLLQLVVIGLFLVLLVIAYNSVQLLLGWIRREAGARLTGKMVGLFVLLAVTPVMIVFFYSVQFLYKGIDNWFDTQVESALIDSLELSRAALGIREKSLLKQTQQMLSEIRQSDDDILAISLDKIRESNQADELTLMSQNGEIIATSAIGLGIIPEQLSQSMLLSVRNSGYVTVLSPLREGALYLRVVVAEQNDAPYLLQALYALPGRLTELGNSVENAFEKHQRISYMRKYIKTNFVMTLSLVLLFSLFSAMLLAFIFARRLMAPIQDLARGTQAIADGDYAQKIRLQRDDDLGFLVKSFNVMSEKISQARDIAEQSQMAVEDQRAYLESILNGLSSGVMTFDQAGQLVSVNQASYQILQINQAELQQSSTDLRLAAFFQPVLAHIAGQDKDWRAEVTLPERRGKQILLCHGTELRSADGHVTGHVVVFEDVTQLLQAQRDAAWGEVARRLAHEIKNPLTPIQLSAERLRHKYLQSMPEKDAKVLDKATSTIIAQVGTMKEMVDAFAEYAKKPAMKKILLDINSLAAEVADLFQLQNREVKVQKNLGQNIPMIQADNHQIRQVLNNLMKNALEAIEGQGNGRVTVCSRYNDGEPCIQLAIEDNGAGFDQAVLGHVFEPYKTTKPKGTGLGLAIVKKIVEEHGGEIVAENVPDGARVTLCLPVLEPAS